MKLSQPPRIKPASEADNQAKSFDCELTQDSTLKECRHAGAKIAREAKDEPEVIVKDLNGLETEQQLSFVEGLMLASYRQPRAGITEHDDYPETVYADGLDEDVLKEAGLRAEASYLAKNLTNTPSNLKNPGWMAEQVKELSDIPGLSLEIKDFETLKEEGFGGICAVGQGSKTPPCLIHLMYEPEDSGHDIPHYALIGKGITFDTGGLNLKPTDGMATMKTDMEGSAVVFAATRAVAQAKLPVKIDCYMAMAENAIGGQSYRPSDVITMLNGKTVEVGNTDAEGRMVMADALHYASEDKKPDYMLDVATLTGAAAMSVGKDYAAFYSNDEEFAEDMIEAGELTGEYLWRMPLPEVYHDLIVDSEVADLSQIAYEGGGGSIMAALFLQEFTNGVPWAHFDIAGPGRMEKDYHEYTAGATGFATRTLIQYFESLAQ